MATHEGVVKSFNTSKGFGFIECEQTFELYQKDMFLMKSELRGHMPTKGKAVSFTVVEEHNGPVARGVTFLAGVNGGTPLGLALSEGPSFTGSVKSFNATKGWGMLACTETEQLYGKDVFFTSKAVLGSVPPLPGDQARFSVRMEDKGPVAAEVLVNGQEPVRANAGNHGSPEGRYVGTVKSFNTQKGYGMIACASTEQQYGKDVFFTSASCPWGVPQPGEQVNFSVRMEDKGPAAYEVQPAAVAYAAYHGAADGKRYAGFVKSFNYQKGFGMISCVATEQKYGKDVFFASAACSGGVPQQGEQVRFSVRMEDKGPVAAEVQLVAAPLPFHPLPAPVPVPLYHRPHDGQRHVGTVKSFNLQKGYGMISCAATEHQYGKDVFFTSAACPSGIPRTGDQVNFSVRMEDKGPAASEVQPAFAAYAAHHGSPNGQRYVGAVKSFNNQKGFGMISCAATERVYGKDVFFTAQACPAGVPEQGAQVQFSVRMENQGPAAAEILPVGTGMPGAWPTQGAWPGVGHFPSQVHSLPPLAPVRATASHEQRWYGSVKSFSEEKGWGHIGCDATFNLFGKDIFLRKSQLQDQSVQAGAQVAFKVVMDAKGPQAAEVAVFPPGSFGSAGSPGQVWSGIVKSFNESKGFGFFMGGDVQQTFGKDIFVHRNDLGGATLNVGDEVQFTVEAEKCSQLVAKNVQCPGNAGYEPRSGSAAGRPGPY